MNDSHADNASLGTYLYCLAEPRCLPMVQRFAKENLGGVDERYPVATLTDAGIVAVIGEVDTSEFHDENLRALPWIGPRALRHDAVVKRIMGASSILPVRFGTLFHSRGSLEKFLERHRERIARVLKDLRDKTEWSVKGYLLEEEFRRKVSASDPTMQLRVAALSPSPGARRLQQKRLDSMLDEQLRAWLTRVTRDLSEILRLHCVASAELRCHPRTVTGRAGSMVFNRTFLVAPEALCGFRAVLSNQRQAHQWSGLSLELCGPWPPYNFCPTLR